MTTEDMLRFINKFCWECTRCDKCPLFDHPSLCDNANKEHPEITAEAYDFFVNCGLAEPAADKYDMAFDLSVLLG